MSASSFNSVLLGISNMLKEENLEQLKFLVRDHIGKQKLERIKTGHQLFEILTERGQLGKDKANYLCQLLRQVQQEDPKYGLSDNERGKNTWRARFHFLSWSGPVFCQISIRCQIVMHLPQRCIRCHYHMILFNQQHRIMTYIIIHFVINSCMAS
uniref:DED domain-containing protein n=1 Tax=Poecilia mexicana TaxID=48701 RepID=A0A3B3XWE1_9TELE